MTRVELGNKTEDKLKTFVELLPHLNNSTASKTSFHNASNSRNITV